ncbi:ScbR family autoregulator-binding transcription factor [Streptomyces sp. NPDC053560]|uniref:ScbR family autoregulator-binding transcription factor n=1 Tax=Streptomyces sp. NPDC053560 TaxID=3365711 RepID=UPI0037D11CB1
MQDRAIRTRGVILRAAAQVFDEYGLAGSSISKIMTAAGTTQGAMYFHFKSKENLARAVINEQAADLALPKQPEGLAQLIELTFFLARQMQSNVLFRAGVTLAVEQGQVGLRDFSPYDMWADLFRGELEAARGKGDLRDEVEVADVAQLLVAAYTGSQVMSNLLTGPDRADLPERIGRMWRYILPGIAEPDSLPELMEVARRSGAAA